MNTNTVEVSLGHLYLAAEILTYMTGRQVPVSHIHSGLSLEVHPCGCAPERYTVEVTEHGDLVIHVDLEACQNTMTIRHDQQVTVQFSIPGVIAPAEGEPYIGIVDPGYPVQIGTIWDGEYELTRRWWMLYTEQCRRWGLAQEQLSMEE